MTLTPFVKMSYIMNIQTSHLIQSGSWPYRISSVSVSVTTGRLLNYSLWFVSASQLCSRY